VEFNYLSVIVFAPVVGAILIASLPGLSRRLIRYLAALFTLLPLALALYLFFGFDRLEAGVIQFEERLAWIPAMT